MSNQLRPVAVFLAISPRPLAVAYLEAFHRQLLYLWQKQNKLRVSQKRRIVCLEISLRHQSLSSAIRIAKSQRMQLQSVAVFSVVLVPNQWALDFLEIMQIGSRLPAEVCLEMLEQLKNKVMRRPVAVAVFSEM